MGVCQVSQEAEEEPVRGPAGGGGRGRALRLQAVRQGLLLQRPGRGIQRAGVVL